MDENKASITDIIRGVDTHLSLIHVVDMDIESGNVTISQDVVVMDKRVYIYGRMEHKRFFRLLPEDILSCKLVTGAITDMHSGDDGELVLKGLLFADRGSVTKWIGFLSLSITDKEREQSDIIVGS